jgi:hypothetical protein
MMECRRFPVREGVVWAFIQGVYFTRYHKSFIYKLTCGSGLLCSGQPAFNNPVS